MKKVDSNNGVWVNDDPATLTNGTPIDADFMNNIQDEVSNVITDNGGTLDGTNHRQLSQTLNKNFAKLNSPKLTGIPLTSNPDGTINNQIATVDYVNQKALQATVGFTPTQQGGGTDQGANKIYIGGDSTDATQVRVQVDQTDLGKIVFQQDDSATHGIDKIGFAVNNSAFAFRNTVDKTWHFSYTTNQIDEKSYISSLPTGDNTKINGVIWNTSSNLPAYYYGTNNQVSYSATTDWVNGNFATQTSLNNETNTRVSANQTLQTNINNEASARASAITGLQNTKANLTGGNSWSGTQNFGDDVVVAAGYKVFIEASGGAGACYTWPEYYASGNLVGLNAVTHILNSSGNSLAWLALNGGNGRLYTSTGSVAFLADMPKAAIINSSNPNATGVSGSLSFTAARAGFLKLDVSSSNSGTHKVSTASVSGTGYTSISGGYNAPEDMLVGSYIVAFATGAAVTINVAVTYDGTSATNYLNATGEVVYNA